MATTIFSDLENVFHHCTGFGGFGTILDFLRLFSNQIGLSNLCPLNFWIELHCKIGMFADRMLTLLPVPVRPRTSSVVNWLGAKVFVKMGNS